MSSKANKNFIFNRTLIFSKVITTLLYIHPQISIPFLKNQTISKPVMIRFLHYPPFVHISSKTQNRGKMIELQKDWWILQTLVLVIKRTLRLIVFRLAMPHHLSAILNTGSMQIGKKKMRSRKNH